MKLYSLDVVQCGFIRTDLFMTVGTVQAAGSPSPGDSNSVPHVG